jgi:hypothetical protein
VPSGKPESFGIFATGRIAQLVEQLTLNQRVPGSSPGAPTNDFKSLCPSGTKPVSEKVMS